MPDSGPVLASRAVIHLPMAISRSFLCNQGPSVKRFLLSTLTLSLMTAFAGAADNVHSAAAGTTSGIETQYIDQGVRVQDDFFGHLNGQWLKTTEIPSDRTSWGTFIKLRDDTQVQIRGIVEATQKKSGKKVGSDDQKIG